MAKSKLDELIAEGLASQNPQKTPGSTNRSGFAPNKS